MEAVKRDRLLGLPRKSNVVSPSGGGVAWAGGHNGGGGVGDGRNGTGDSKKSFRKKNRSRCGNRASIFVGWLIHPAFWWQSCPGRGVRTAAFAVDRQTRFVLSEE